ncbi:MAG: Mur ligase family protein [Gaiella sp.]
MTRALVEGFAPDAVALGLLLARRGHGVRLAGPGAPPDEALAELVRAGVAVTPGVDLDRVAVEVDAAYLDVWTPEVAPRVGLLRARGARVTSLAELVLDETPYLTIGITGTAGKTTTASFLVQLLRRAGEPTLASERGYAGQRWPNEELLVALDASALASGTRVVLELTSSHLAFCRTSPRVAVVTSFWPDHLELHGSLAAYRAAKEQIVAAQGPDDQVVVNADDREAARFAERTPARRWELSTAREVERGAFLREGRLVARVDGAELELGPDPGPLGGRRQAVLAAVAAALAAGVSPSALSGRIEGLEPPPFRAGVVGMRGGALLVDDGMAATPSKAAATLAAFPARSVVLVAGGRAELDGRPLHASAPEAALLARAADEIARAARAVVVFGPGGDALARLLPPHAPPVSACATIDEAIERAVALLDRETCSSQAPAALVLAPLYALTLEQRERASEQLQSAADAV